MTLCQLNKIDAWFIVAYQTLPSCHFEFDYDHKALISTTENLDKFKLFR